MQSQYKSPDKLTSDLDITYGACVAFEVRLHAMTRQ